jgi:hypothetical protein
MNIIIYKYMSTKTLVQPNDDTIICNQLQNPLSIEEDEDCIILCFDDQKLLEQTDYEYKIKTINAELFNIDQMELYYYFQSFQLEDAENAYIFSELTHKFFTDPRFDIDHDIFDHDSFVKSLVVRFLDCAKTLGIQANCRVEYDLLNLIDNQFDKLIKGLSKLIIQKSY